MSEIPGGGRRARGPGDAAALAEAREQFAANVRRLRRRSGFSQERLAARCALHRSEISLLERGARDPRLSTIVRLALGLGVSPGELLVRIDEPTKRR